MSTRVEVEAREVAAAVRRQLWVAALVVLLVAAAAILRYARAGSALQEYLAAQSVTVQVLPPAGGGGYAAAVAQQLADRLSRALATGAPLTVPAFDQAVATQVTQEHGRVAARYGADAAVALDTLDAQDVRGALSATQTGSQVVITARWPTAAGAWALATAAGEVLATRPDLALGALPAEAGGASARVVPRGAVTAPALDPALELAARLRLVETMALGVVGGLALAFAVDRWPTWRRRLIERPGVYSEGGHAE